MLVFALQILKVRQNLLTRSKAGSEKALQAGEGRCSPLSTQPWWDGSAELCLVLGSPGQEKHGHTTESPEKGHSNAEEVEASDTWGEAERAGAMQPGEDKGLGGCYPSV